MKKILSFVLFLLLCLMSAAAQPAGDATTRLFNRFKAASGFDRNYPREKVYLHFDNTAYLEGDTLWYKAYVVRASSLQPTQLSRILYVELLNADGQQVELQTLHIDSLGQADGCFKLTLPVRAGFYEVRAFTRQMVNWGEAACFSRILPVFAPKQKSKKAVKSGNVDLDELEIPMPSENHTPSFGSPRPQAMTGSNRRLLEFYPEGGNLIKGLQQQLAFELTDGRGYAVADTVQFFSADGTLLAEAAAEHDGMGSVLLQNGTEAGFARIKGRTVSHPLPRPIEGYALQVNMAEEGMLVDITASDSVVQHPQLMGLAVMSREKMCYFDTLTIDAEGLQILVPQRALRQGVNRVELFDASGRSCATRMVWSSATHGGSHMANLEVKQNKRSYEAFEPAVLTMKLTDAAGRPIATTFSLSVRDRGGILQKDTDGGIMADLLLSSEVRGYIHNPELYFARDDARHRRMLDLLLLVRGWTANSFDVMCGATDFNWKQPIEDKLILRGRLFKDNNKFEPQSNFSLNVKMYKRTGEALDGVTKTDESGYFAFESNVDFEGDFIAQFTMRNDEGKKKWSRLTIDRWFMPPLRPLRLADLELKPFTTSEEMPVSEELQTFEWTDTIPYTLPTLLGEAKVTTTTRYKGFTGNRYTWDGGEKTGMTRATKFYNIQREVERYKDRGLDTGTIWDFMAKLNSTYDTSDMLSSFDPDNMTISGQSDHTLQVGTNQNGLQFGVDDTSSQAGSESEAGNQGSRSFTGVDYSVFRKNGVAYKVYLNNENINDDMSRNPERYESLKADEIKSASLVDNGLAIDAVTGQVANRSKSRYALYLYEIPDYYRYKDTKGVEHRVISGFTPSIKFYNRNYRSFDLPSDTDVRRTLLWDPAVRTNGNGETSVVFFTNSRMVQYLDISVRGITKNGDFIEK